MGCGEVVRISWQERCVDWCFCCKLHSDCEVQSHRLYTAAAVHAFRSQSDCPTSSYKLTRIWNVGAGLDLHVLNLRLFIKKLAKVPTRVSSAAAEDIMPWLIITFVMLPKGIKRCKL